MIDSRAFNLVDESFIQVQRCDGTSSQESLSSVFAHAHRIREITGDLPTQSFAILRMLLAILQRAILTADDFDEDQRPAEVWGKLWRSDRLPVDAVGAYLDRWHHRFDLFDKEWPFMQAAGLRPYNPDKVEGGGLSRLIADYPNRPERALFTQRGGVGLRSLSFAEAARWLIHCQSFDTGNNKSRAADDGLASTNSKGAAGMNTGWAGKIGGVFLDGDSLRETMLLNLVLSDPHDSYSLPSRTDLPCWESTDAQTARYSERPPRGRADLYTWQSRRILLQPIDGKVTNVLICPGDISSNVNTHAFEPMTAWRANDKGEYRPMCHQPDKAMWHSLSSLLPRVARNVIRPGVVSWADRLRGDEGKRALESRRYLTLRGVGAVYESQQNAAIGDITDDTLVCPAALLDSSRAMLLDAVLTCVAETDSAVAELGKLSFNLDLSSGHRESNPDARKRWAERERRMAGVTSDAYFTIDSQFRQWLASLDPPDGDWEAQEDYAREVQGRWRQTVSGVLLKRGAQLVASAGPKAFVGGAIGTRNAESWMTSARAERFFRAALRRILHLDTDDALSPSINEKGVDHV